MLEYAKNGETLPLDFDQYYIQEEWNGWEDTLHLSIPVKHPQRPDLVERLQLTDRDGGQVYVITSVDEGVNTADITAALDLDELRADMLLSYSNGSDTASGTIHKVLPANWSLIDYSSLTTRRTIEFDGATPLDIIKQCVNTYKGLAIRFNRKTRQVLLYHPATNEPSGVYYTDELNLTERPQFKGSATDFYTRLYPVGADGLTISGVNRGKAYVECHDYTDAVICRYWKDERYTDPASLLADATEMVKAAAVPARSYTCAIADLAKIDPNRYGHLSAELYQVVTLMNRERNTRVHHKVAQYCRYPHHPERNVITLSTVPGRITSRVQTAYSAVTDTAGTTEFSQRQAAAIAAATAWLTNGKGYKVERTDSAGNVVDTLYMDTPDIATAVNVLRIGQSGIGFSHNGVNGPYISAWAIDGAFNADYILAGTMQANRIKGGTLTLGGENNANGIFVMLDSAGNEIGRWNNSGVNIIGGKIKTIGTANIDGTEYASEAIMEGGHIDVKMSEFSSAAWPHSIGITYPETETINRYIARLSGQTTNGIKNGNLSLGNSNGEVTVVISGLNGTAYFTGTVTEGSDRRLKTDIRDVPDDLIDAYLALAPRLFTLIASGKPSAGLIAQEVQGTPLEELLVVRREDTDLLMLDYTSLHALALAAIQQMHTRLTALEDAHGS